MHILGGFWAVEIMIMYVFGWIKNEVDIEGFTLRKDWERLHAYGILGYLPGNFFLRGLTGTRGEGYMAAFVLFLVFLERKGLWGNFFRRGQEFFLGEGWVFREEVNTATIRIFREEQSPSRVDSKRVTLGRNRPQKGRRLRCLWESPLELLRLQKRGPF